MLKKLSVFPVHALPMSRCRILNMLVIRKYSLDNSAHAFWLSLCSEFSFLLASNIKNWMSLTWNQKVWSSDFCSDVASLQEEDIASVDPNFQLIFSVVYLYLIITIYLVDFFFASCLICQIIHVLVENSCDKITRWIDANLCPNTNI